MTYQIMVYCWTDHIWFIDSKHSTVAEANRALSDIKVENDRAYIEPVID